MGRLCALLVVTLGISKKTRQRQSFQILEFQMNGNLGWIESI